MPPAVAEDRTSVRRKNSRDTAADAIGCSSNPWVSFIQDVVAALCAREAGWRVIAYSTAASVAIVESPDGQLLDLSSMELEQYAADLLRGKLQSALD